MYQDPIYSDGEEKTGFGGGGGSIGLHWADWWVHWLGVVRRGERGSGRERQKDTISAEYKLICIDGEEKTGFGGRGGVSLVTLEYFVGEVCGVG